MFGKTFWAVLLAMWLWQGEVFCGGEHWRAGGGVTSIRFYRPSLENLGVFIIDDQTTAEPLRNGYAAYACQGGSELVFDAPGGDFETLLGGELGHEGGFLLRLADRRIDLKNFFLKAGSRPGSMEISDRYGVTWLILTSPHAYLRPALDELLLLNMDMWAAPELAILLGQPEWAEIILGTVDLALRVTIPEGEDVFGGQCIADFSGQVDVTLSQILSIAQFAREEGGRVAIAPSASLANAGSADVPWFRSISPDGGVPANQIGQHPFLAMHFYRLAAGVMRQIGRSDVKHAFFAVNSGCSCNGDQILFVGCGDTYGAGTNANPLFLAPRQELTASSGDWRSLGSHFDGVPVDDFRHHGSAGHDPYEHRLTVLEPDLETPGAQYFMEAWYIVKGDINIFNGIGYRRVQPSRPNNIWLFPFADAGLNLGAALDAWVDPNEDGLFETNQIITTAEGHLQLAVLVTPLSERFYRYEYALMNLDFDRQIRSLSIPVPEGVTLRAVGFNDVDDEAANDWVIDVGGGVVSWSAPSGNALDWGTLYNFRFEAEAAPGAVLSLADILETGPFDQLEMQTKGPRVPCSTASELQAAVAAWGASGNILDLIQGVHFPCP